MTLLQEAYFKSLFHRIQENRFNHKRGRSDQSKNIKKNYVQTCVEDGTKSRHQEGQETQSREVVVLKMTVDGDGCHVSSVKDTPGTETRESQTEIDRQTFRSFSSRNLGFPYFSFKLLLFRLTQSSNGNSISFVEIDSWWVLLLVMNNDAALWGCLIFVSYLQKAWNIFNSQLRVARNTMQLFDLEYMFSPHFPPHFLLRRFVWENFSGKKNFFELVTHSMVCCVSKPHLLSDWLPVHEKRERKCLTVIQSNDSCLLLVFFFDCYLQSACKEEKHDWQINLWSLDEKLGTKNWTEAVSWGSVSSFCSSFLSWLYLSFRPQFSYLSSRDVETRSWSLSFSFFSSSSSSTSRIDSRLKF